MNKHHIPKCIWCFWDSKDLPDTVKLSLDTWKHFNPDYKITVINKKNIKKLIPNINFDKIKIAKDSIQKYSDFIRICVLRKYGGIWIDGSSFSTCSFDEWFHKIGIKKTTDFIGYFNPQFNKVKYEKKYPMIENWFFACPKNSKFVNEWYKEFMKLKNFNDVNDYIDEVVKEGIDMQYIDDPQYLTQHLAAQAILQRGYNMKNMILLNAIKNKYGNGPLHYYISPKAWTLTEIGSVRTLCKDKKEWSQPIVKLVGDTRRIVENNKGIKKCVFKIIEDLLKDKKDLGNKRTKRTKRTKRNKKRTIKRKGTIRKRKQSGGMVFPVKEYHTLNEGREGNPLPVFHLEIPGKYAEYNGYWKVLEKGPNVSSERDLEALLKISFQIEGGWFPWSRDVAESAKLGHGTFGIALNGSITELQKLPNGEKTFEVLSGLEVGRKYAIKLMKIDERWKRKYSGIQLQLILQALYDAFKTEFKSMKYTYGAAPNLFLRPHLLLQKDGDSLAIVMELGGKSLNDHLGKGTEPFKIKDLKRHIGDLAVAIATIHSMGYIHRDLKPDNILLVDYRGHLQLKVIDLGLMAKTEQKDKNPMICCVFDNAGTMAWMQPESAQKRQPETDKVGRAFDWWAFGLIILQLLGYFGEGKISPESVSTLDDMPRLFRKLRNNYYDIYNGHVEVETIARECSFYAENSIDREDLLKFAFYFLDPESRTRPFLHLEDDSSSGLPKSGGERAEQLQGLVNKLFPNYGITPVTSGD